ncbi:MAG: hypothetical protein U0031_13705 [Thermomicrobiales bacterium]
MAITLVRPLIQAAFSGVSDTNAARFPPRNAAAIRSSLFAAGYHIASFRSIG